MADRYESRASTHAEGCWDWGPGHYGCAVGEIKRLREMLQCSFQRGYQSGARGLREMYDAVQAVKRQDAWGNTQLTEALLAAEERAEKAEAERSALLAERDAFLDQHHRDSKELRRLCAQRDAARKVSKEAGAVIADLKAERDALREALDGLVGDIESLAAESDGVAGFHQNGDLATWAELMPGGRFEWLEHMDKARAALAQGES